MDQHVQDLRKHCNQRITVEVTNRKVTVLNEKKLIQLGSIVKDLLQQVNDLMMIHNEVLRRLEPRCVKFLPGARSAPARD